MFLQCCTTPVLSSILFDDWSKNDTETWKGKSLGNCTTKELKIKNQVYLTLSKTGKSRLFVEHITIVAKSPDKKITELEQFKCSKFDIGASKLPKETKPCYTSPYSYQQIEKATFQIGNYTSISKLCTILVMIKIWYAVLVMTRINLSYKNKGWVLSN